MTTKGDMMSCQSEKPRIATMRRGTCRPIPAAVLVSAFLLLNSAFSAWAQVPGMVSFQGVLKDSLGQPLSGAVTLEFRIFDEISGGALVDMDGDGAVENVVGQDVKEVSGTAIVGVVSTHFGPVSPAVLNGAARFIEVTIVSPGPATALTRVPMTTSPAVAEQLFARGTTNVAVTTMSNGYVGVGTMTPAARLTVSSADQNTTFYIQNTSNGGHTWALYSSGATAGTGPGYFRVIDRSATDMQDRLIITPTGDVGIGNISPSQRLAVSGNICASGSIGVCSDARFKNETGNLAGALGILDHLRPVRFTWRRDAFPDHKFSAGPQIGFIAQEVEQIVPEVVTCGSDGYYNMDYGRLTPVLTAAVQELHARHNAEVAELRAKNAELEARLERLEELLAEPDKKGR